MGDLLPSGDAGLDLELLTASLRADASDVDTFFEVFADKMTGALGNRVTVERGGGGLLRRGPTSVHRVLIGLGDRQLEATKDKDRVVCRVRHAVRGVVLRTEELAFDEWLLVLGKELAEEAKRSASTRAALQALLT
jgi:hypothetical protein